LTDAVDDARRRYIAELPAFLTAADGIKEHLEAVARLAGIHAEIDSRAKTVSSFIKKLQLKGAQYEDPWLGITDKLGARMIVETLPDLMKARSILEDENRSPFVVKGVQDKSADADTSILYYPGVHIQVIVPGATTSDHEPIECEVQLRTKAQDLWSVPSHKLVYKPVLDPSRESRRRIMRLSVLVEIFDEEVERAMAEVTSMPGYEEARLLAVAESQFFAFVSDPGEQELSFEVFTRLRPVIESLSSNDYERLLEEFVQSHRSKLQTAYEHYGADSEFASEWSYWLVSQPESIVIWHLVTDAPMMLAGAVAGTDLETSVRELFAIWGSAFPDIA